MAGTPPYARSGRPLAGARQRPDAQIGAIEFRVGNFKALASAELTAHRLTVLAGANSSGKSSLLQALLFVAQSVGEPTLVLNGDLVRLGEPRDVIRDGTSHLWIELGYRVSEGQLQSDGDTPACLRVVLREDGASNTLIVSELALTVDSKTLLAAQRIADHHVAIADTETLFTITSAPDHDLLSNIYITTVGLLPRRLIRPADNTILQAAVDQSLDALRGSPMIMGQQYVRMAQLAGGHEDLIQLLSGIMSSGRNEAVKRLPQLGAERRDELLQILSAVEAPGGWISEPITANPTRGFLQTVGVEEPGDAWRQYIIRHLAAASGRLNRMAHASIHLGPLRDEPRVAYPLGHTVRALPVGERGEFTAAYLQDNVNTRISYRSPTNESRYIPFPKAVSEWSDYLGIAETVSVEAKGKLGHQIGLNIGGRERDPTMIGVGASQLLPVIALVLGAPRGSLVMLEQPELHLHPKVQSRLADFLAFARPDIRVVIETHSEYLVTRLRRRAAEEKLVADDVSLLFAALTRDTTKDEATTTPAHTELKRLTITALGDLDAWPRDFFDSLDRDVVALTRAIRKRLSDTPNAE